MTDLPIFIDTNIFLCYATDFEENHAKSLRLFHGEYNRHTGIRVRMELNKIKKRRVLVYKDLYRFYKYKSNVSEFKPSVSLKENDAIHLRHLLDHLKTMDKSKVLKYLRTISRIIDQGVRHALSLVASLQVTWLVKSKWNYASEMQMMQEFLLMPCVGLKRTPQRSFAHKIIPILCLGENQSTVQ